MASVTLDDELLESLKVHCRPERATGRDKGRRKRRQRHHPRLASSDALEVVVSTTSTAQRLILARQRGPMR